MRKVLQRTVSALVLALAVPAAYAQSTSGAPVSMRTTMGKCARLELSRSAAELGLADGAVADAGAIHITAKARVAVDETATLRVLAEGGLSDGAGHSIAPRNLCWAVAGDGFQSLSPAVGLVAGASQTLGSWTGSGLHSGTFTLQLANDGACAPGTYTGSLTLQLVDGEGQVLATSAVSLTLTVSQPVATAATGRPQTLTTSSTAKAKGVTPFTKIANRTLPSAP